MLAVISKFIRVTIPDYLESVPIPRNNQELRAMSSMFFSL